MRSPRRTSTGSPSSPPLSPLELRTRPARRARAVALLLHDEPVVESYPDLCLAASWLHAVRGRAPDAQHWGDATLRGLPGADARLHVLQALRCRDGADQMLDDTTAACGALPPGASWRPSAMLAHGVALCWRGMPPGPSAPSSRRSSRGRGGGERAADRRPLLPCAARHRRRRPSRRGRIRGRSCCGRSRRSAARSVVALLVEAVAARNAARRDETAEATPRWSDPSSSSTTPRRRFPGSARSPCSSLLTSG